MEIEELRHRLQLERGNYGHISKKAKIPYRSLLRFAAGDTARPWGRLLSRLEGYFARPSDSRDDPVVQRKR